MNTIHHKKIVATVCAFLFVFLIAHQVQAQQEKPLNLQDIRNTLVIRSSINVKTEELNEQLITEIRKRKVNFILTSEDEVALKKVGGNNLLIKIIRENLPKKLEEQIILYKNFTDNYAGNSRQRKIALEAAKEFVKRYSDDESVKEIIEYFIKIIPQLDAIVNCCIDPLNPNYDKFDNSLKAKNWDDLFEAGTEILKNRPEFFDVTLVLASAGFDNTKEELNRNKYLEQTLYYAEKSIELLQNDKSSKPGNYGAYQYSYKTKEFPDGNSNALGYMNYIIGYIKYFYLNQKDEAFSYFQKSLQYKSQSNQLIRQLNLPVK